MATVAFIHARAGSKRCPGKNTRLIAGKPLIVHTIEQAKRHPLIDEVMVSTDDNECAKLALWCDVGLLMRPDVLCRDDAAEWHSWEYAIKMVDMDVFVNLPCTCPLRGDEDISRTIEALKDMEMAFTIKHVPHLIHGNKFTDNAVVGSCYVTTPAYIQTHDNIFGGATARVTVPEERSIDIDTEYDFKVAKLLMENP